MFPTMFRGLHKPEDLPQETFLSSPADVAPEWHNLNAAGNHFQAADSLSCEGTPSSSQQSGQLSA